MSAKPRLLAGASRHQTNRATRAQRDIYQTHFREFRGDRR